MADVKIFLSTVTKEFRNYRDDLSHSLTRPNVTVKVQEDFIATGTETLVKLDEYIQKCNVVIHLVGDMTGAWAKAPSVEAILRRYPDFGSRFPMLKPFLEPSGPGLSYTQWEAWLALYHHRVLLIAVPKDGVSRYKEYQLVEGQRAAQQEHLERLKKHERYPEINFTNFDNLAWQLWRSKLHDIVPQLPTPILERVREMASLLLDVGRATWKTPQFVAPLNIEAQEEEANNEHHPTNITALTKAVDMGENLVLFGEGGIGKTTFLLELSAALLTEECLRIPLYIDAADWARTNNEIMEYIANRPAALQADVSARELLKMADTGHLTLAVNGWNEMPEVQKLACLGRFREITTTTPSLNIIVVTRSVKDIPDLKTVKRIHVRGLSWQNQLKIIRFELDENSAKAMIELLARNTSLRHSARSPLILKGVIAQAKKGEVASFSDFGLLGAVVDAFEEDSQHRHSLKIPPLRNQHRHFLEALAFHLTSRQEINSSRQEVLPVISSTARKLVDGEKIESHDVLDALGKHHIIHTDDKNVRFAHQRFREYFTATQILRACIDGGEQNIALLRDAINQPFWEDALLLVADELKGDFDGYSQARSLLVRTALGVDLSFACDLAGTCEFYETDDTNLYRDLVAHINALCDSPLPEVANYGLACLPATGFTIFADRLWQLIESDDLEIRLNTYRLSGGGISLKQLDEAAETRIATWSPERRVELIHELADNSDNYDFLVRMANMAIEVQVRAAAISALSWNFPASDAALQAWFKAPADVQLEHNIISVAEYALEEGIESDKVREKLRILSREHADNNTQLRLAIAFPDEVGLNSVEVVLDRLRQIKHSGNDAPLIALAMKYAPDRLNNLARELMLSECVVPEWARKIVQQGAIETRAEIFEAAWDIILPRIPYI